MSHRHRRGRPEDQQPAQIKRMPDISVKAGSPEIDRRVIFSSEVEVDLPKPEKIEVVDEEGASEHCEPSESEERVKTSAARRVLQVPDHSADWPPLPEE